MRPVIGGLLAWTAPCLAGLCAGPAAGAQGIIAEAAGPRADVGYAVYEGYYDKAYDLNVWKGIRYAAAPVGKLRWQAPQRPARKDGDRIACAARQPPLCPQSDGYSDPEGPPRDLPPGDEDCLFLNVHAPAHANGLPVFVWIHGGGNSLSGAEYDPSDLMKTNDNSFVVVEIQYRLGAFGYLASSEVKARGALNAGLLDQRFAMEWVGEHIAAFGGDPGRVTIGGESSGGGSSIHHALAYGGQESHLFTNIIAASPWLPAMYPYDDPVPTGNFKAFAKLAGCDEEALDLAPYSSAFDCLVAADSALLQNASNLVSTTRGHWGTFGFGPVIDGDFVRERPSAQLQAKRVSGKRLLVGTNANEGMPLTDPHVSTRVLYDRFVSTTFPRLTPEDVRALNDIYRTQDARPGSDGTPRYDTLGDAGPTALNQSGVATGIQQAAFNINAETLFQCPAQWFAEAFGDAGVGRRSWRYQYSLQPAIHGADLPAYWPLGRAFPDAGFRHAFQRIWGSFIVDGDPVISVEDAMAGAGNASVPGDPQRPGMILWPGYSAERTVQMVLNTTGGNVVEETLPDGQRYPARVGEGIVNTFRVVDAVGWEGGRGERCAFWLSVSPRVPQ